MVPESLIEQVEQNCSDEIAHRACNWCQPRVIGSVLTALCGARKVYRGPRRDLAVCVVCNDLMELGFCEQCGGTW